MPTPTPTPPTPHLLPLFLPSYPYSSPPIPTPPLSCHYALPTTTLPLPTITSILPIVSSRHSFMHFHFIGHMLSCLLALAIHIYMYHYTKHGRHCMKSKSVNVYCPECPPRGTIGHPGGQQKTFLPFGHGRDWLHLTVQAYRISLFRIGPR